jgi:two-component system chemotaxis sensor kinase CheA
MESQFREILPVFAAEAREHLQEISAGVFELEKPAEQRDPSRYRATCRAAHNLKGSAATLGLNQIEELSHALETVLVAAGTAPTVGVRAIDAAVQAVSALEAAVSDLAAGGEGVVLALPALITSLQQSISARPASATASSAGSASAPATTTTTDLAASSSASRPASTSVSAATPPIVPTTAESAPVAQRSDDSVAGAFRTEAVDLLEQIESALEGEQADDEDPLPLSALSNSLEGTLALLDSKSAIDLGSRLRKALSKVERGKSGSKSQAASLAKELRSMVESMSVVSASSPPTTPTPTPPTQQTESTQPRPTTPQTARPRTSVQVATVAAPLFRAEAETLFGRLEAALAALRSPKLTNRAEQVTDAMRDAHTLRGIAGALGAVEVAKLAGIVEEATAHLAQPGPVAVRALVTAAGALVDAREALSQWSPPGLAQVAVTAATPTASAPSESPAARVSTPRPVTMPPTPIEIAPSQPSAAVAAPAAPAASAASTPSLEFATTETGRARPAEEMQRVPVTTLDELAQRLEELVMARAREEHRLRRMRELGSALSEASSRLQQVQRTVRGWDPTAGIEAALSEAEERLRVARGELQMLVQQGRHDTDQGRLVTTVLREDLRGLRTVPAALVLEPLRRTARETAVRLGKRVEIDVRGAEVRVDRRILESVKDPLLHLVRNAVDHGIESPERRRTAGKSEAGRLELLIERRGQRLAVVVRDDGGGLDLARVRQTAVRKGLLTEKAAKELSDAEARHLIFRSGFSTAEQVSAISGRGIGLDVVEVTAARLQGSVQVESEFGRGTTFTLDLPLTLAATLGLLVRVGTEMYALPTGAVERVVRIERDRIGSLAGQRVIDFDGEPLALTTLAQLLSLNGSEANARSNGLEGEPALVLHAGKQRLVLVVDELAGQQELVVHSLGVAAGRVGHLAGVSVLDDGRLVPVLNAAELVGMVRPKHRAGNRARSRVLVVDDSPTTRSAMRSLLELAGYEVVPARDGEEAWEALEMAGVDLVVSDVQMPRLDGFGLTRRLRADPRFVDVPVVLVTSLESADDRAAGNEAGATGYLVKREVERGRLLEMVEQLLPRPPA